MSPRALRRHHEGRLKRRVRDYYGGYARSDARAIGKLAHTRTLCSCPMCGNPRRHSGEVTIQERRVECEGIARVRLPNGVLRRVELHWYEAHGIGRKDLKIKRYLEDA